jgi:glycosyltransferase involved in cell wall biosynthesis
VQVNRPSLPKVSVCVASYNHARFLPATLESVIKQTYPNVEVVIVDDGSRDSSLQIANDYCQRYPDRVRLFTHSNHSNRGISETLNLATEMATGEFWSCLGSDDVLYPDKLERQVTFLMQNSSVDWVYGFGHFINDQGRRLSGLFGIDITQDRCPIETLILGNRIPAMTVLARRGCIEKVGNHNKTLLYSDWEFWIRMLANHKAGFIARPLVQYRIHGSNVSLGVERKENWKRGLAVMESLSENSAKIGGDLNQPRSQALIHLQLACHYFHLDNQAKASRHSEIMFEADPSLQSDPAHFSSWLKGLGARPPFFRFLRAKLSPDLNSHFRKQISKRLVFLQFAKTIRNTVVAFVPDKFREVLRRSLTYLSAQGIWEMN